MEKQSETLVEALDALAGVENRGFNFLGMDQTPRPFSFSQIQSRIAKRASVLTDAGLVPGDRVGLVVVEGQEFILSFLAVVWAGGVPVPMYPPMALGRLDGYMEAASRILTVARARFVIAGREVASILWSLVSRVASLETLLLAEELAASEGSADAQSPFCARPEDCAFLQFTSGSTSDPKGVKVTHRNLVANASAIMFDGLTCDPDKDLGLSWLPLYHDMGLIGFVIAPIVAQVPIVFMPTMSFIKRPSLWMDNVDRFRATITFAPNFAFGLATRRAQEKLLEQMDLSCVRVLGCGAEPIRPDTIHAFLSKFARANLNPNAFMPCYGMAEATLAIAFDDLDSPFSSVRVAREAYEDDGVVRRLDASENHTPSLEFVSCGRTFPQHEVAVLDSDGNKVGDGLSGELAFRGPSVSDGYFENPSATKRLLRDGWLHTDDVGFILDGEVFVSGRKKDLIILNGRNHYPQNIEWVVERVDGVRRGNVVAFSVAGEATEQLVVVAESKLAETEKLGTNIKAAVKSALGLKVSQVCVVSPGALPKTSSGKLQRNKTRLQYEAGTLGAFGSRAMGSTGERLMVFRHFLMSSVVRSRVVMARKFQGVAQVFSRLSLMFRGSGGLGSEG